MTRRELELERHLRLACYATLSFVLAVFGYLFLDFDSVHALAYAVSAFVLLNLMNYRQVLAKIKPYSRPERPRN